MIVKIPFLSWTGKAALEVEIADDTDPRFHVRAAVQIAVGKRAHLIDADLSDADLRGAVLSRADLSGADLRGAVLSRADLSGADLRGAVLRDADLRGAHLSGAVLRGAHLSGAVLRDADLRGAHLSGADLSGAVMPPFSVCPEVGSFTAFKKLADGLIATLEIPAEAKRVSQPKSRKCRAEFVKVLKIEGPQGEREIGHAQHDGTEYRVGEIVRPDSYNDDIREECTNGIHFFITRREAEDY